MLPLLQLQAMAAQYGFDACSTARAEPLYEDAKRLEAWLLKGRHGGMQYMENHFDLRVDPTKLVPGAKTVITLLKNYYPKQHQPSQIPKVSKYAYGKDYHLVIRKQLKLFLQALQQKLGNIQGRGFVDSAPVLERAWATKSGLGWVGKNGNLINKKTGSFFFIATLIVDVALPYSNEQVADYCGTCTKCIDACPTKAILPNKEVNGSACISYFTIELKEILAKQQLPATWSDWLFGCDICQDVCPWNRFSRPHSEPAFEPNQDWFQFTQADWEALTEESFKNLFGSSPLKRTKFSGIRRNIAWIKK